MDANDHRMLGPSLDLFHFQDDGQGMPFWHPRGWATYRVLEDFLRARMRRAGYGEIRTPQLMSLSLWEKSGHWEKFSAAMFRVDDEERSYALKPMSCPCHVQVFNHGTKSWRDLPVRYSEFGACHRNEPSGSLSGLMRARSFCQDDAHVFCTRDHVGSEVTRFVGLLREAYAALGFSEFDVALSLRPEVRAGSEEDWDVAEGMLAEAAARCGMSPVVQPGEGAFYGPKLEFSLKDVAGRSWQCGTVQVDFVLPKRLGASYVDRDGGRAVPIMVHHAILGSMERFVAILIEQHAGRLPPWLAPDQVAVAAIGLGQSAYADEVYASLSASDVRAVRMGDDATMARKVVEASAMAVPFLAVVGAREEASRSVSLRSRDGSSTLVALADLARHLALAFEASVGT